MRTYDGGGRTESCVNDAGSRRGPDMDINVYVDFE